MKFLCRILVAIITLIVKPSRRSSCKPFSSLAQTQVSDLVLAFVMCAFVWRFPVAFLIEHPYPYSIISFVMHHHHHHLHICIANRHWPSTLQADLQRSRRQSFSRFSQFRARYESGTRRQGLLWWRGTSGARRN